MAGAGRPPTAFSASSLIGHADSPLRGIAFSLAGSIVFCAADTIAKKLSGELAIVQIVWTR
jgi:hypothetical protein